MGGVVIYINGKPYTVSELLPPDLSLADFIRDEAGLTGTKQLCREGGCGACVVAVTRVDPVTQKSATHAVNSCLTSVFGCHGWHVTTVEGLGSRKTGLHAIQDAIATGYGSQCGFCTPGMVMSTYSLLCEKPNPSAADVDHSLDGNLCRCTGYRPILQAMRGVAACSTGAPQTIDIEDLNKFSCPSNGSTCHNGGEGECSNAAAQCLRLRDGVRWYKPSSLDQLYSLMAELGTQATIVAGDTAKAIMKEKRDCPFRLDISGIEELYEVKMSSLGLSVGAGVPLSSLGSILDEHSKQQGFSYGREQLSPLLLKVASTPIRNVGSLGGNLMIKHTQRDFPSDLYTALEGLGATVKLGSHKGERETDLETFLTTDLTTTVLMSVTFPHLPDNTHYMAAKVMPRAGNCYAYVNAGFRMAVENDLTVAERPRIVFGGLGSKVSHAQKTEDFLVGKSLTDSLVVKEALSLLKTELCVEPSILGPSVQYRTNTAVNLLFKFFTALTAPGEQLALALPLSVGSAEVQALEEKFPVTQPMPKLDADIQATGEAMYSGDQPAQKGRLEAYVVMSTVAKATIEKIDVTKALKSPGVHKVITAKDIPGKNDFNNFPADDFPLEFLATSKVHFVGQPIAVIVADSRVEAKAAAALVDVTYSDRQKPILDIKEAIEKGYMHNTRLAPEKKRGDVEAGFAECDQIIEGDVDIGSQFHFYLEPHTIEVTPTDDGFSAAGTTAWPNDSQHKMALILGLPLNNIHLSVPRMGGSFGGKHEPMKFVAALGALAANATNKPVRLVYDLSQCMQGPGRRFAALAKYKVGLWQNKVHAFTADLYLDTGSLWDFLTLHFLEDGVSFMCGALWVPHMLVRGHAVKTDHAISGPMRAPGPMPASIVTNSILAHVAHVTKQDLSRLIEAHLVEDGQVLLNGHVVRHSTLHKLWAEIKLKSDLSARQQEVDKFNQSHKYVKRGLASTVSNYMIGGWPGGAQAAYVTIYALDGSVAIAISGVEFGQGLYTKCAQVAAFYLGVPIERVRVKATDTLVGSNSSVTAGSKDSELCARTVQECCKILQDRLSEVRGDDKDLGWNELLMKCFMGGVNLSAHCKFNDVATMEYQVFGAAVAEAEVDLLTGQHKINRVDAIIDLGESMNPENDRGQVEGALIIGLGEMFTEHEVWDPETGRLLTDSTWEYKPPSALDVPSDMRIYMLKDAPNQLGITGAKAVGEPPIIMTPVFLNAVRAAIEASRIERGVKGFCKLDVPATIDRIQLAAGLCAADF